MTTTLGLLCLAIALAAIFVFIEVCSAHRDAMRDDDD